MIEIELDTQAKFRGVEFDYIHLQIEFEQADRELANKAFEANTPYQRIDQLKCFQGCFQKLTAIELTLGQAEALSAKVAELYYQKKIEQKERIDNLLTSLNSTA